MFKQISNIETYLIENGLEEDEVQNLLNGKLQLANIFTDFGGQELKPVACNPEKLASYLISDDTEAIKAVSGAMCNLNDTQISQMVYIIQTNINLENLIARGEEVANKTLAYDVESFVKDMSIIIETMWNMTAFQDTEIPPVLHSDLWAEDFGTLLNTWSNTDDIDFAMWVHHYYTFQILILESNELIFLD